MEEKNRVEMVSLLRCKEIGEEIMGLSEVRGWTPAELYCTLSHVKVFLEELTGVRLEGWQQGFPPENN